MGEWNDSTKLTLIRRPRLVGIENHWVDSEYVEDEWLPIIGPTSWALLRRLDRIIGPRENPQVTVVGYLAHAVGTGSRTSKNSPLRRTLDRLWEYDCLDYDEASWIVSVPTHLPTVRSPVRRRRRPVQQELV